MKKILLVATAIAFFSSCIENGNNDRAAFRKSLLDQIKKTEEELNSSLKKTARPDNKKAESVITLYEQFADSFPDDSIVPVFLFREAQLAIGIARFQKAILVLKRLCNAYPKSAKTPDAVFLIAFVYDEHLSYKAKAKEWYEKLIKSYPNHPFARDAEVAIRTLNMSDEEILEMLKEKNRDDDTLAADQ